MGEPRQVIRSVSGKEPRFAALPLRRDQFADVLREATGETPAPPPELTTTARSRRERQLEVLLVEDNRVNQIVASSMLHKLGYQVDVAGNGARALEALRQRVYDIVLMDCQMPVMDGYTATAQIRRERKWANLPIIAVTANVMQGDKDLCIAAGMNDYITKPYNKRDLEAVIEHWAAHQDTPTP
jgi:CheY-like chemotaxis protein